MKVGELRDILRGLPNDYDVKLVDSMNHLFDLEVKEIDEREVRLTEKGN